MPPLGEVGPSCSHGSSAGAAGPGSLCRMLPFLSWVVAMTPVPQMVPVQDLVGARQHCCAWGAAEPQPSVEAPRGHGGVCG